MSFSTTRKEAPPVSKAKAARLWLGTALKRAEEIDRGTVQMVSPEEFEARVHAILELDLTKDQTKK